MSSLVYVPVLGVYNHPDYIAVPNHAGIGGSRNLRFPGWDTNVWRVFQVGR